MKDINGKRTWSFSGTGTVDAPELVKEMQSSLGSFDMIFEDAEVVVKAHLTFHLHVLQDQNPEVYRASMNILTSGDLTEISNFIQEAILNRIGYPHGFEGRVPVAVPPDELLHF